MAHSVDRLFVRRSTDFNQSNRSTDCRSIG